MTRLCSLLTLLVFPGVAAADSVYVIANNTLKVSSGEIREIFLGEKQFVGATKVTPVDNASAQNLILGAVLQLDANKYKGIWTKKSFRDGVNPPAMKGTDLEVVEFVKATPGAVGYVTAAPAGVAVVAKY